MAAVGVAASGGRDSTALLHACARAAGALGLEVHALHVHHGLVPEADAWLRQLRAQCRRWAAAGLPLHIHARRLSAGPGPGESVEAWARRERYRALAEMAREAGCDLVLLAQHRRDQAETLLLQALRGGGPAGLAAMPRSARRDGITWARPWLEQPREAIEAYLRRHHLAYVDDASNADPRFARNRLRLQVWPSLVKAFPDAEVQLEAAAARAQEAAACLADLAAQDLEPALEADALRWSALPSEGQARRRNALRVGLRRLCGVAVPETLLDRLLREAPGRSAARWPAPGGELRLHDGRLRFAECAALAVAEAGAEGTRVDLSRPGRHELPAWGGTLVVTVVAAGGIAAARLRHAALRRRGPGVDFQRAPRTLARSLKKQFQAARLPAWERGGPLVYDGVELLFVPGLGIDARCLAAPGELQLALRWEPAAAG